MTIEENIALAPLTTLRIGGPARYFAEAANEAEVLQAGVEVDRAQLSLLEQQERNRALWEKVAALAF